MAKFSVGREDDSEGPSRPRAKKPRTTCTPPLQQEQQLVEYEEEQEEEVGVELESDDAEEEEEEQEAEEGRSEHAESVEEDVDVLDEPERADGGQTSTDLVPRNSDRGSAGLSGDGFISVILTDPDVLDCPICLEHLCSPVFQCENGHIACSSCCVKIGNKCPSCSWPIGYNRCRAIEKVIESVKISCQNMKYGCRETMSYNRKHDHEETCLHAPCSCPLSDCDFVGSSKKLSVHFSTIHPFSGRRFWFNTLFMIDIGMEQKHLILQEQNDRTIFVLNNGIELLGNAINVCCIGPSSSKKEFTYDLIARKDDSSLRLQSSTKSMPHWVEHSPSERFLLVPSDFCFGWKIKLELCIRRHSYPSPL